MVSILKPRNLPAGVSLQKIENFNWEDVLASARLHLEEVRKQARVIIEQAKSDVEQIKSDARSEGRQAAQTDVEAMTLKQATAMADDKIAKCLQSAELLTGELERATEKWLRQWQHETVPLAISIAERLVRRQIDIDPTILLQWITDSIALARGEHSLHVRIHPADRQRLGTHLDKLISSLGQKQNIELIEDDSIASPGLIIESEDLHIDAQLMTQLDRVVQEMQ